jgi:hypothetical protein
MLMVVALLPLLLMQLPLLLVRGWIPVPVGARLQLLLLQQQADTWILLVVLLLPLLLLQLVVMLRLLCWR